MSKSVKMYKVNMFAYAFPYSAPSPTQVFIVIKHDLLKSDKNYLHMYARRSADMYIHIFLFKIKIISFTVFSTFIFNLSE